MVKAAAIYCRISQARRNGDGDDTLGVDRQERLCRELADQKGWSVAEVYVDNDISAYSGKRRPAFERLLADLRSGERDAVLCVDIDRLTRRPAELEEFIDLADANRIALANVSGDTDLSTSDGRFKARIMGAVARQESEKKSERQKREREQAARAGIPHGGQQPFGYGPDRIEIIEEEAALIREAADRVLAGESVRSICFDWNDRGIPTRQKAAGWTPQSLRGVLLNPRYAGLRRYAPRDRHGNLESVELYPAVWDPIIDREVHEQVTARLTRGRGPPQHRGGRGLGDRPSTSCPGWSAVGGATHRCTRHGGRCPPDARRGATRVHRIPVARAVVGWPCQPIHWMSAYVPSGLSRFRMADSRSSVKPLLAMAPPTNASPRISPSWSPGESSWQPTTPTGSLVGGSGWLRGSGSPRGSTRRGVSCSALPRQASCTHSPQTIVPRSQGPGTRPRLIADVRC